MNKVLLISCVFPPEPVVSAQISKDIAIALAEREYNTTVLAPFPSRPDGFNFDEFNIDEGKSFFNTVLPNVKVKNLKSSISSKSSIIGRFYESFSFGKIVSNYLKFNENDFDIVYINSWPIFSQYLIAKTCIKLNIPYIIHVQDIYPESLSNKLPRFLGFLVNKILLPFDKFHLQNAKKIIVISENMKNDIAKTRNISNNKFEIVYNWQDESSFTSAVKVETNERFTFMYLGNIGPVAGVETVVKAFVAANLPHCNLIIAGNGANKESCIALAKELGATNINFLDVPNGEVANTQRLADVLLLPVIRGGANSSIPSKLPAYMLSAKPIIGTLDINTATADAIINAKCGWVGPAEDELWLSNQMSLVCNMPNDQLKNIGRSGYDYGKANFSKQINLDRIINQLIND